MVGNKVKTKTCVRDVNVYCPPLPLEAFCPIMSNHFRIHEDFLIRSGKTGDVFLFIALFA